MFFNRAHKVFAFACYRGVGEVVVHHRDGHVLRHLRYIQVFQFFKAERITVVLPERLPLVLRRLTRIFEFFRIN